MSKSVATPATTPSSKSTLLNEIENFIDIIPHFHWFHYLYIEYLNVTIIVSNCKANNADFTIHFYFIS